MSTRKQLLRCLIEKVILQRQESEEELLVRIIWRGGAFTEKRLTIPPPVRRSKWDQATLVDRVTVLVEQGHSDLQIAQQMTAEGFRSVGVSQLKPSTVARIRTEQGRAFGRDLRPQPPTTGPLTIGRVAAQLGLHRLRIYHLIYRGLLKFRRDPQTNAYLIPDTPNTLELIRQLHDGQIHELDLTMEHQDA